MWTVTLGRAGCLASGGSETRPYRTGQIPLRVVLVALALSVVCFFGYAGQAHACKCVEPGSPSEEMAKFDAVFAGRVVSVHHSYDPEARSVGPEDRSTIGFEVSTVWKGAVHESTTITTPPTGGSCGYRFVEGESYVVYAYDSPYGDGGYTAGICGRTALLAEAQADVDELGNGDAPLAGTSGPSAEESEGAALGGAWVIALVVVGVVLAVGGGVAYLGMRRRRAD
ncbi:MAG: hypothetical protein OXG43_06570 [Chloroflexi bacterium]|nr:hypothetical protein [Chloroflexota bacterium]